MLSICIPTFRRPGWLRETLDSIFLHEALVSSLELCISNGSPEANYEGVESLLAEKAADGWKITYLKAPSSKTVDENMLTVLTAAQGVYCLLLGDDDLILPGQLNELVSWLKEETPALAVFDAQLIDERGRAFGRHLGWGAKRYASPVDAFRLLRQRFSYGSIVARRSLITAAGLLKYDGTAHCYAALWLDLLNGHEAGSVQTPPFPCVALRHGPKEYELELILFRDVPLEFYITDRWLEDPMARKANLECFESRRREVASLSFLCRFLTAGGQIPSRSVLNFSLTSGLRFRIAHAAARVLIRTGIYGALRRRLRGPTR